MKARVFISCGQKADTDEPAIADAIAEALRSAGFDPYIAVRERTLRGLVENIFNRLAESEYFLFVDFKREPLTDSEHRGSLFCHQELAVASFLQKRVLVFRERGVKKLDGIVSFLQANATEFGDREDLPRLITHAVAQEGWNCEWRDELSLSRLPEQHADELHLPNDRVRYWHITVTNHNPYKTAFDCHAYLRSLLRLDGTSTPLSFEPVEYKWRGVAHPSVILPPKQSREFDAFWVRFAEPHVAVAGTYTDSPRHCLPIIGPGSYLLSYSYIPQPLQRRLATSSLSYPAPWTALAFARLLSKSPTSGWSERPPASR